MNYEIIEKYIIFILILDYGYDFCIYYRHTNHYFIFEGLD